MQTCQFGVYSLSHSVYLILTHQVNISPALNHPQAIFEETRDHLYCQSLPELLKPASPKLFALPCPALPTKSTIKAVAQVFPSFLLLPPDQNLVLPLWPCMALLLLLRNVSSKFFQWHWSLCVISSLTNEDPVNINETTPTHSFHWRITFILVSSSRKCLHSNFLQIWSIFRALSFSRLTS